MDSIALLVVAGVLLVIGCSWIAPRIGIAAPIVLLLVGVVCSYLPGQVPLEIEPEWILAVVLPPILYAAAVNVPINDFKRNFRAISGLSVVLVALSAIAVGLLLAWLLPGLPLAAAIALGAVVSPPDAVAATSIGKRLGLPPRLVTVLEGEGLVNDATALVLLRSAIAALGGAVTLLDVAGDFVYAVAVAIAIGLVVGVATVWARARLNQPTLTTAISFVVPFLAYLPAESVHASGVLAVVVAGLITGYKSTRHLSAQDRISERMNWRTIQLLLENGVFLLMGYQISTVIAGVEEEHLSVWGAVGIGLIVTIALLFLRAGFMVPMILSLRRAQRIALRKAAKAEATRSRLEQLPNRGPAEERRLAGIRRRLEKHGTTEGMLAEEGLGWRGGAVLSWSGMRGVVTLAAAQSLPLDVPFRAQLILIGFTVAMATLLLYGTTLPAFIRLIRIAGPDEVARRRELNSLVQTILEASAERLDSPELLRENGRPFDRSLIEDTKANRARVAATYVDRFSDEPNDELRQRAALWRLQLEAEQAALLDARASGAYSSEAIQIAQNVIDIDVARSTENGVLG